MLKKINPIRNFLRNTPNCNLHNKKQGAISNGIKFVIPYAITLTILYLLLQNFDIKKIQDVLVGGNKITLFFAVILLLIFVPTMAALRWKETLKFISFDISFYDSFKIFMASLPLSKISPSNAGDFSKSYYLKNKISPALNAGTVIFERIIDMVIVSIFALIGGLILNIKIATITGSLTLLLIIIFFAIARKIKPESENKWLKTIRKVFHVFSVFTEHPGPLLKILFYTFLSWSAIIIYIKMVFFAFGENIPFLSVIAIQSIVILISALPITISGIGARESAMVYLYGIYGGLTATSVALTVGLTYSFLGSIILPLLGLPFMYKAIKNLNKQHCENEKN